MKAERHSHWRKWRDQVNFVLPLALLICPLEATWSDVPNGVADTVIYDRPFRRCLSAKRYANSNDRPTDRKIAWLLGIACRHNAAEALVAIDLTMLGCALCPIARAGPATIPRSPILKLEATLFRTADKAAAEAYVR